MAVNFGFPRIKEGSKAAAAAAVASSNRETTTVEAEEVEAAAVVVVVVARATASGWAHYVPKTGMESGKREMERESRVNSRANRSSTPTEHSPGHLTYIFGALGKTDAVEVYIINLEAATGRWKLDF